jgi:hypothetical protein
MKKPLPFILFFVVGIFTEHFASFISKHAPALTVKPFSAKPEYYLLIPPGKGLLRPWILAVRKSHDDIAVESAVIELAVIHAPCSL